MKPTLYIMCGPPGCGKSTFAHEFMKQYSYISRDAIRFEMVQENEDYFSHEKEVFEKFTDAITTQLQNGMCTIADATHIDMYSRKKLTYAIDQKYSDYNIVYVVFETSLDTCLARNRMRSGRACAPDDVISKMYSKFRIPRPDEDPRMIGMIRVEGNVI